MGVSTGGVLCLYGLGLDGNDPLLSYQLFFYFSFLFGFGVALGDNRSCMGGVMIWSPCLCIGAIHVGY